MEVNMLGWEQANPSIVKKWRAWCLTEAAASGGLLGLTKLIQRLFPEEILGRLPDYEIYIHAALAISLITVLFLTMIPKIITLSFAQLGTITSMVYLGYSFAGIFITSLLPVFFVIMTLAIVIMTIVFWQSIVYFKQEKAYVDLVVGCISLIGTAFVCVYPMYLLTK
jgi:hypothetical protein